MYFHTQKPGQLEKIEQTRQQSMVTGNVITMLLQNLNENTIKIYGLRS